MPYVIKTSTDPLKDGIHYPPITRRATLLRPLRGTMNGRDWVDLAYAVRSLPESGGTIGPLPDGTVIEVEPANWDTLKPDWNAHDTDQTCCDAYNAQQGGE
jgi:hypothetical protein